MALLARQVSKNQSSSAELERLGVDRPTTGQWASGLARLEIHIGNLHAAIIAISRALEIEPDNASNLAQRAEINRRRGDPQTALQDLHRALALRPEEPTLLLGRAYLRHVEGGYSRSRGRRRGRGAPCSV